MRNIILMAFALCLLLTAPAKAADAEVAKGVHKIGVVDMQVVATESEPAKAAKKQMESKYSKERDELEKQGKALQKKAEALKDPKASEEKKLAFIRAKQDLDQKTRNFMRKVEQEELTLRQDMVKRVFSATYEVARAKGFDFVVDITAGGVLYADKSMDLTTDVLEEVNKQYKADQKEKKK
ncbi:MAG: OmpH family outer membrane protein [Desulfovibrio sp.]|nr:OmpH family outer membrane protein [Desulfovibrio sp.]